MVSNMEKRELDVLFIGAVMDYDGSVGSLANYIKQDDKWITPHQYIYQKRPEIFGSEANACVYDVPNLSICKLADHLKRHIDDVSFHIVWHFNYHKEEVLDILQNNPPHLVAISTTLAFYTPFLCEAIQWIQERKHPDTKVIIGGKWLLDQYNLNGAGHKLERTLDETGADYAVINNFGEEALRKVLLAMREGNTEKAQAQDNIAFRTEDRVVNDAAGNNVNKPDWGKQISIDERYQSKPGVVYIGKKYCINQNYTEDLEPGDPMINFENVGKRFLSETVHVRTCSSCPFKCRFCTFPVLSGEHVLFDLDDVMVQLKQPKEMGVKSLFFVDDTFNVPKRRFKQLMELMIEADLGIEWVSFYRPQYADAEITRMMYEAGCRMVLCGFGSGNDMILKMMDKKVTVAKYLKGLQYLRDNNIVSLASYIVGYPGETVETVKDTMKLVDNPLVDFSRGSLFYYDTNAPVAQKAEEWQLTGYGAEWSHFTMDYKEAQKIHLDQVSKMEGCNIPVSDGGAWSIFNLYAKGLSWDEIKQYYRDFTDIQAQQIKEQGSAALDGYRAHAQKRIQVMRDRRRMKNEQKQQVAEQLPAT